MTFKPVTYLASFALFVMVVLGLGAYVGYGKLADHFLAQAYLEAMPINSRVAADQQGALLRWEDRVTLQNGVSAQISANSRSLPISIQFSDEPEAARQSPPAATGISLAANERAEDLRIDRAGQYLYARVFATSNIKSKETTWLYKYDLQNRKILRRTAVNPILLPAPFRP